MTRLEQTVKFRPQLKVGVGGNYYVVSKDRDNLDAICVIIKKARSAVYFNDKYNCWTIRVKKKEQKESLKKLFEKINRPMV